MKNVSVSLTDVEKAERICREALEELNWSSKKLRKRYEDAGRDWSDSKYRQLGDIVNDCMRDLQAPVKELSHCIAKLTEIQKALLEYQTTNVGRGMSASGELSGRNFYTRSLAGTSSGGFIRRGFRRFAQTAAAFGAVGASILGIGAVSPENTGDDVAMTSGIHTQASGPAGSARELHENAGRWAFIDRRRRTEQAEAEALNRALQEARIRPAEHRDVENPFYAEEDTNVDQANENFYVNGRGELVRRERDD